MTIEEERTLVQRAQKGDSAAFEDIVRAHEATVYRLALRQLGSREDAEDAASGARSAAAVSFRPTATPRASCSRDKTITTITNQSFTSSM